MINLIRFATYTYSLVIILRKKIKIKIKNLAEWLRPPPPPLFHPKKIKSCDRAGAGRCVCVFQYT